MNSIRSLLRLAAAGAITLGLAGCLGGGDPAPVTGATAPAPTPSVPGSQAGTLTDAAVGGVSFRTSSGASGITAADGSYSFNPGDTVTFMLGGLTLGTVTATGIVTPMELSGGSEAKLGNLLVLLQSLDADGNPANGISIPSAAAAAVSASVNLAGSTATFAADAGLQAAMTAGGIGGAPRSAAAASAHFLSQGMALLSGNIWVNRSVDSGSQTHTVILRIEPTGRYTQVEFGTAEEGVGHSGVEFGTLTVAGFTSAGYNVTSTIAYDDNGEWGASHLRACDHFRSIGEQLVTSDCADSRGLFGKMENAANGLVGAWLGDYESSRFEFYFFADGTFIQVIRGSDYGYAYAARYSVSGNTVTVTVGESDSSTESLNFSLSADGKTLTLTADETTLQFARISR